MMGRIFADIKITDVRGKLSEEGFIIKQDGDNTFAINFSKRIIINLTEEGFDLSRLKRQYPEKQQPMRQQQHKQKKSPLSGVRKLKDAGGGSRVRSVNGRSAIKAITTVSTMVSHSKCSDTLRA